MDKASSHGESQGWSRHWEILDRVGLPDYTPDVLWQADVLHRAGVQVSRPFSNSQDRRAQSAATIGSAEAGGDGGGKSPAGEKHRASQQGTLSPSRPATTSGPGSTSAAKGGGHGGDVVLHPRLRPGLAKQPANRARQPRVPLVAALNLRLVDSGELLAAEQEMLFVAQTEAEEDWEASPPSPRPGPHLEQQQHMLYGTRAHAVPRVVVPGSSGSDPDGNGSGYSGYDRCEGPESAGGTRHSFGTLPPLATNAGALQQANVRGAPSATAMAEAPQADAGDGDDTALSRAGSAVSFRIPKMSMAPTPTARTIPGASALAAPLRKGSTGVTWSESTGGQEPESSPLPPPLESGNAQDEQRQRAPSASPSRKPSAGALRASYPNPNQHSPYAHPYGTYTAAQLQRWQLLQARSLSGEPSTVLRHSGGGAAAAASTGPTPRQRYKGILERVGRAVAHKPREWRRPGSVSVHRRSLTGTGSDLDVYEDADNDDVDGGGGSSSGGSAPASPPVYGGLARWGARWIRPLAERNAEMAGRQATSSSGCGAAASPGASINGNNNINNDSDEHSGLQPQQQHLQPMLAAEPSQTPSYAPSQAPSLGAGIAATATAQAHSRGEAAAQRLGRTERAVWQLRRALDELSRFSCAHASRLGDFEDGSVLSQVEARIQALRQYDKVELGADGRRVSVLPLPPPSFPLAAAREYLSAAQSGVAGLEQLEEAVAGMRRKLQIVVGQDTGDLRRAAADALADAGGPAEGWEEPGAAASETASGQAPYILRRPSSGLTLGGGGGGVSYYGGASSYRLTSARTTASGLDASSSSHHSPPSSPYKTHSGVASSATAPPLSPMLPSASRRWPSAQQQQQPYRKGSSGAAAACGGGVSLGVNRPSGPGMDQAWSLLESLMIQLHDSHASRVQMMDALDTRPPTSSGELAGGGGGPGGNRSRPVAAAAAMLAAAVGGGTVGGSGRLRGGGLERLARLVDVVDDKGGGGGIAQAKEAAAEAAVNGNAARAAVAATLEPKHTEQALYFLAKLALMLQQDPRFPLDAGFLVSAGVDLLLGEVSWLLALLRASSGAQSPHLAALAAALRAYEMQRSYTVTLRAVAERLEAATEEAIDRSSLLEQQLSAASSSLQCAGHEMREMESNMRDLERDMKQLRAQNALLEGTVAELEGDIDRVEVAHCGRETTLRRGERLAGALREEHLGRIDARSRGTQVASEGDCSDPRAIPPLLEAFAAGYYPITPCVSTRNLPTPRASTSAVAGGRRGPGIAAVAVAKSIAHAGAKKQQYLRKPQSLRRTLSHRGRGASAGASAAGTGAFGSGAAAAAAAAAALAAARAAAELSDKEEDEPAVRRRSSSGAAAADGPSDRSHDSSRLSALKRSGATRTVSWVDRAPTDRASGSSASSPDPLRRSGAPEGRISPVVALPAGEPQSLQQQQRGQGGVSAAAPASEAPTNGHRGSEGSGGLSRGDDAVPLHGGGTSPTCRSARSRLSPKVDKPQALSSDLSPPDPQQQHPQPRVQKGVDGLEYWAGTTGSGSGAGTGSGDGWEQGPLVVVRDEALEAAARDMFSDVFGRQPSPAQ